MTVVSPVGRRLRPSMNSIQVITPCLHHAGCTSQMVIPEHILICRHALQTKKFTSEATLALILLSKIESSRAGPKGCPEASSLIYFSIWTMSEGGAWAEVVWLRCNARRISWRWQVGGKILFAGAEPLRGWRMLVLCAAAEWHRALWDSSSVVLLLSPVTTKGWGGGWGGAKPY